jgi:hypothetical protein
LRKSIDRLDRRIELEGRRDGAGEELDHARQKLVPLTAGRAEAREASHRFQAALERAYRDPRAARRSFHEAAKMDGVAAAAADFRARPERFGELKGTGIGPVRSAERTEALRTAPMLEPAGADHMRCTRAAWDARHEFRAARSSVTRLERRVRDLDGVLARGPGSAELKLRIGRELNQLQAPQRQVFKRSLPLSKAQLVAATLMATHAFAREQGHER